jgi:hypothetical protein
MRLETYLRLPSLSCFLLALGLAGLMGCESGWDPDAPGVADGSGTWQGIVETDGDRFETGGMLLQEGDHLAGYWDGLAVSGSMEDGRVTLVNGTLQNGVAVTTTLIGVVDGERMMGTVSFDAGNVEVAHGTFAAARF